MSEYSDTVEDMAIRLMVADARITKPKQCVIGLWPKLRMIEREMWRQVVSERIKATLGGMS